LAKEIVTDLCKEDINFHGLVFTDALNMKGVADFDEAGQIDLAALLAGNDVLLISENVPKATQKIIDAYHKGIITEKRLASSVRKILFAKYKVGLNEYRPIETNYLTERLNRIPNQVLYEELMENAVTVIKNNKAILPIK